MAFCLTRYGQVLAALADRDCIGVADFISAGSVRSAILRHDVDRMAWRAVAVAGLEARHGVRSTYYFRCSPDGTFPWRAIEAIAELGHEVGYHYECLSASGGDRTAALAQFEQNLRSLRRVAPCRTVAMHGAPLSIHRNQDLLVGQSLADYELLADASLSFSDVPLAYFTDTGGRWNASSATNFRDRVGINPPHTFAPDEPEFTTWLAGYADPVYINTHPERWPSSHAGHLQAAIADAAINLVKRLLAAGRERRGG